MVNESIAKIFEIKRQIMNLMGGVSLWEYTVIWRIAAISEEIIDKFAVIIKMAKSGDDKICIIVMKK